MADFVLARKSRNLFGGFLHAALNVGLGVCSIVITVASGSWVLGVLLVLLSKWRVFAVRPRFWWLNIKSNLVDFIVGLSVVLTAYFAGMSWLPVHYILMFFYVIWLTFIKPMTSNTGNLIQALAATFFGNNLAVIVGSTIDSSLTVVIAFVVGYGACRHVLIQDNVTANASLPSIVCGLVAAELALILHGWGIVYTFWNSGVIISQLALIATILTFTFNYVKESLARYDNKLQASAVALPIVCAILAILVLLLGFSEPFFNI